MRIKNKLFILYFSKSRFLKNEEAVFVNGAYETKVQEIKKLDNG